MYSPAPGVVCRRARQDDCEAVLAINEGIHARNDYLPGRYSRYMNEPDRILYVLEKDGRVVAFAMRFIVDGGETGVEQGGRVVPELQGTGLSHLLTAFVDEDSRKDFPNIRRLIWTSNNRKVSDYLVNKYPEIRLVLTRPRISFVLVPKKIRDFSHDARISEQFRQMSNLVPGLVTRILTPSETSSMLNSIPDMKLFAPEGYLLVDWEPFGLHPSNYAYIAKYSTGFASYDTTKPGEVVAFSFGSYVKVRAGLRHRIDFYSKVKENMPALILAHVQKHIILLSQNKFKEIINIGLFVPQDLAQDQTKRYFTENLGLSLLDKPPQLIDDALLLEQSKDNIGRTTQSKM